MSSRRSSSARATPSAGAAEWPRYAGIADMFSSVPRRSRDPASRQDPDSNGRERRLAETLAQRVEALEHARRPSLEQLLVGKPAGEDADRGEPGALGRFAIPGRVADHHGGATAGLLDRRGDQVGLRLRPLDV